MPKRIQMSRKRGWRKPEGAVYVGRPTKWGNPFNFRASEYCWVALSYGCSGDSAGRQEASVRAFREWIDPPHGRRTLSQEEQPKMVFGEKSLSLGPLVTAGEAPSKETIIAALRGKDLGCWCKIGEPCHADVLLEIANASPAETGDA